MKGHEDEQCRVCGEQAREDTPYCHIHLAAHWAREAKAYNGAIRRALEAEAERDRLHKALSGAVLGLKMVLTKPTEAQAKMLAAFDDVLRGDGAIFDVWAKDETP